MVATLQISPEERTPLAYLLALESSHLAEGTKEHREIAAGLRETLDALMAAPEGPVELELYNDEIYMLGVRNHADASELEEYWLDNKASMHLRGERAPFSDEHLQAAISRFYAEVVENPDGWDFQPLRPVFQELGFKVDRSMTVAAPRGRGIYNKERAEIIRRTRAMQTERALQRGRMYPRGVEIEAWRQAVRDGHLAPGEMGEFELDGKRLLLANVDGEYHALDGACTHAPELSAVQGLAKGMLETDGTQGPCVTCPWHGAQFNLRSGRTVRQPYAAEFNREHLFKGRVLGAVDVRRKASDLRTYRTKVENGYVWVNVV